MNQVEINLEQITLESLPSLSKTGSTRSILRLDKVHPIVSGNKWFKLRYYIAEALEGKKSTIASFGGAFSNHIVALAYACKALKLESVGFIRGEEAGSITLQDAAKAGMQLHYISRNDFNDKIYLKNLYHQPDWYWINEGGYGKIGAKGASTIFNTVDLNSFTHIVCAVGTGTMMAGLIDAANCHQQIIGISVLKNNFSIEAEVKYLLKKKDQPITIFYDYHFGGYAKHTPLLLNFMNELYLSEALPTDIVYTGKLMFAVNDLLTKKYFGDDANILVIHSGGLQGNRSLADGKLVF
ncbi:MAG: pyridoxal-phosphate dependent enzyme [Sphingobacteriia bacterium]|nr:MAG: pyridoxal-phosphate dependent enzyme [Sphingobacteriia bacterium]